MDIAQALRQSRNDAGKSQEYMAFELQVARRTIQNWELGKSEPSLEQAMAWFRVIGKNPIPFLLQLVFPEMEGISALDSDEKLRAALIGIIEQMPMEGVRELLYLFYGNHGSSPRAVLNMVTAHLQTPMDSRITQASIIAKNYELAQKKGTLAQPGHVQPEMNCLKAAIDAGERAVLAEEKEYSLPK